MQLKTRKSVNGKWMFCCSSLAFDYSDYERTKDLLLSYNNDYFLDLTHGLPWEQYIGNAWSVDRKSELKSTIETVLNNHDIKFNNIDIDLNNQGKLIINIDGVKINV